MSMIALMWSSAQSRNSTWDCDAYDLDCPSSELPM